MRWLLRSAVLVLCLLGAAYGYSYQTLKEIERSYPPVGEFVTVGTTRLHYVDEGSGEVVVLLHGASASLADFSASIAPLLARRFRVIAFDRPGYGHSERPGGAWVDPSRQARLVRRALVRLGIDRATMVGHSIGGAVALAYALEFPESVAGVGLVGGAAYPWEGGVDWTNHAATWPILGPVFTAICVVPAAEFLLQDAIRSVFAPNEPSPTYVDESRVRLTLRPSAFRASAEDVSRLSRFLEGQSRRYRHLRIPLLLITGTEDSIVPPWNHAHRLHALLPSSRLVELERTGHVPHHVHPERVATLIGQFLDEVTRPGS